MWTMIWSTQTKVVPLRSAPMSSVFLLHAALAVMLIPTPGVWGGVVVRDGENLGGFSGSHTDVLLVGDPTCADGEANEGVCCLKSCGAHCAISGCGGAKGGAAGCCGGTIRKNGQSCASHPAPCVLGPAPPGPPPPAPGPSTCSLNPSIEYLGNDTIVKPAVPSAGVTECCDACSNTSGCTFFTFDATAKTCTLRSTNAPDTSRPNPNCTSGEAHGAGPAPGPAPQPPAHVVVAISASAAVSHTGPSFVAWNIDASRNRGFFTRSLNVSEPLGARLAKQAAALSAETVAKESILRFGGSGNDYLTYAFDGTPCPPQGDTKECMNMSTWVNLLEFAKASNARIIFGLSMNTGHDLVEDSATSDPFPQPWDPSNAEQILKWTIANGYSDLIMGFELGNEQNSKYTGAQIATDFGVLYNLVTQLWPDASTRPKLVGPDPHSYHGLDKKVSWIADFLTACKAQGIPIYAATHHEYSEVDSTTFTSPASLDISGVIARMVNTTARNADPSVQVWGGEIGPHNGGSPPCDHTSMRWANFGDSLWYADALAQKARWGYQAFCRQDYIGADYGLVDCSTGTPLPDFFTGLLFSRTMGLAVLNVNVVTPGSSAIRAYAHCGRSGSGSVGVLLINLNANTSTSVSLTGLGVLTGQREQYLLQPSNQPPSLSNSTGLLGTGIRVNGAVMVTNADGSFTPLTPTTVADPTAAIVVPPTSIIFTTIQASPTTALACAAAGV